MLFVQQIVPNHFGLVIVGKNLFNYLKKGNSGKAVTDDKNFFVLLLELQ